MAITDVNIANIALREIAGEPITVIDDTTPQGAKIDDIYTHLRDHLLRSHHWNFAIKRGLLGGFHIPKPEFEFDRKYLLPSGAGDYKEALRVVDIDRTRSRYKLEGKHILSNLNGDPTNLLADEDDFTSSNWTETNTGATTANSVAGPDGTSDADSINDNDGTNRFFVSQAETVGDDKNYHFMGVKIKTNDASHGTLQCKLTGGTTTVTAYVELDFTNVTLVKGGAQAGQIQSYDVESLDSSYFWLWMNIQNNQTGNTTLTWELYPSGLTNDAATVTTEIYAVNAWLEKIEPVEARWVEKITDPDEMTADFRKLFATALARELAIPEANSGTLFDRMDKKYNRLLRRIRSTDAIEDFPESFPEGSWATSRFGSLEGRSTW